MQQEYKMDPMYFVSLLSKNESNLIKSPVCLSVCLSVCLVDFHEIL
jgi:hypothetical protein